MGVKKFALKMLVRDMKESSFFLISMIFSVIIIFNIFNITYNESLVEFQKESLNMLNYVAMGIIAVSVYFIFFANSFFLLNKTKELGIVVLSGLSTYKVGGMLFFQSLILIVIAVTIGIGLGIISTPLFLKPIFDVANINGNIFSVSTTGLYLTIACVGILGIFLILFNWGYIHRNEIIDLVKEKKNIKIDDFRTIKTPKILYLFIFILPVFIPLITLKSNEEAIGIFVIMMIVTIGTQGVIRYIIPDSILFIKKKHYFADKLKLISLSNLYYSIRNSGVLVLVLAIESSLFITLIATYSKVPSMRLIYIFVYILITILISVCILYKVLIEAHERKRTFVQLKLIGYNRAQIQKIILQEMSMLGMIIVGAPLFHLILLVVTFLKSNIIDIGMASYVLGIFVVCYLVSTIISYLSYKKIIIKDLYGGI